MHHQFSTKIVKCQVKYFFWYNLISMNNFVFIGCFICMLSKVGDKLTMCKSREKLHSLNPFGHGMTLASSLYIYFSVFFCYGLYTMLN